MRCEICQSADITVRACDMAGIGFVCAKCEHLVLQILKGVLTMGVRYSGNLNGARPPAPPPVVSPPSYTRTGDLTGPPCPQCGNMMQPNGKCHLCPNCGYSGGCGG